jgi:uncharacterized membrane protein
MTQGKLILLSLAGMAFLGLIDSAYLGITSLQGFVVPCSLTGGCEEVLNSSYSHLFGLSISWFGFGFYLFVAICALFSAFGFDNLLRFSLVASTIAMLVSFYLLFLQAFVLGAFCQYCLLSALLVILIFALHLWVKPWKWAH